MQNHPTKATFGRLPRTSETRCSCDGSTGEEERVAKGDVLVAPDDTLCRPLTDLELAVLKPERDRIKLIATTRVPSVSLCQESK